MRASRWVLARMLAAAMARKRPSPLISQVCWMEWGLNRISVDQQVLGHLAQPVDGPVHGEVGRLQNVDPADFLHAGPPDAPGGRLGLDGGPQAVPRRSVKRLLSSSPNRASLCRGDPE